MCGDFAGTRAEREWLAVARRIAEALERIANQLEEDQGDSPGKES